MTTADRKNFDELTRELLGAHVGFVNAVQGIVKPTDVVAEAAPRPFPVDRDRVHEARPINLIEAFCGA